MTVERRRVLAGLCGAAGIFCLPGLRPARAASDELHDALAFFDAMALTRHRGGRARPRWVRKWRSQVHILRTGAAPAGFDEALFAATVKLTRWTGLPFRVSHEEKSGATGLEDIVITVRPHQEIVRRYGLGGNVCTTTTHGWGGRLHTGHIDLSDRYADCLEHELMHALGFDAHWHGNGTASRVRTVLALRRSANRTIEFSPWDELAIRTLYHPRLKPGMRRAAALPIALEIIASSLKDGGGLRLRRGSRSL